MFPGLRFAYPPPQRQRPVVGDPGLGYFRCIRDALRAFIPPLTRAASHLLRMTAFLLSELWTQDTSTRLEQAHELWNRSKRRVAAGSIYWTMVICDVLVMVSVVDLMYGIL
jgi:hypothetical protein